MKYVKIDSTAQFRASISACLGNNLGNFNLAYVMRRSTARDRREKAVRRCRRAQPGVSMNTASRS